jgi:hypothetical protein
MLTTVFPFQKASDEVPSLSSGKDRGHIGHLTVSHEESARPSFSTTTALVGGCPAVRGGRVRPCSRLNALSHSTLQSVT